MIQRKIELKYKEEKEMFCQHCGSKLEENVRFCPNCGQPVETSDAAAPGGIDQNQSYAGQGTPTGSDQNQSYAGQSGQAGMQKPDPKQGKLILQIFAGVFAGIFAILFIKNFFGAIGSVFAIFNVIRWGGALWAIFQAASAVLRLLQAVTALASGAVLVLAGWGPEEKGGKPYFVTFAAVRVIAVAVDFLQFVVLCLYGGLNIGSVLARNGVSFLGSLGFSVIVMAALYGILYMAGQKPLDGVSGQNLVQAVKDSMNEVLASAKKFGERFKKKDNVQTMNQNVGGQQNFYMQQEQVPPYAAQPDPAPTMQPGPVPVPQPGPAPMIQPGPASMMRPCPAPIPQPGPGFERLKTDRSLLLYIIFSFLTCGIYSYYFIYKIAKDVNVACQGDGDNTPGLLMFVLLSMVTCGIYAYYWYYKLGNRLAENAPRYGMNFQENGTTVIMWMIFGIFLCGIGVFVAWNILIKNTNRICQAYNRTCLGV